MLTLERLLLRLEDGDGSFVPLVNIAKKTKIINYCSIQHTLDLCILMLCHP